MKLNRIILPAMAMALTLAACEDNKMEWGTSRPLRYSTKFNRKNSQLQEYQGICG